METKTFDQSNQTFEYDLSSLSEGKLDLEKSDFSLNQQKVFWLNIYGFANSPELAALLKSYDIDEFVSVLMKKKLTRNRLIEFENSIYASIKVLVFGKNNLEYDQIKFVLRNNLLISVQEKEGDYFDELRDYIRDDKGIVRRRFSDYLLFKMMEAILENYQKGFDELINSAPVDSNITKIKPNPRVVLSIEQFKGKLLTIKTILLNFRNVLTQLENLNWESANFSYFASLKESASSLIDEVDLEMNLQESKLNLVFNLQSHRLNEVMKILTIFSVIFIPLTFMAGIYGMNFDHIPELHHPKGYFILLGSMLIVVVLSLFFIKRKKWF